MIKPTVGRVSVSEWQPIETAPDDVYVLLAHIDWLGEWRVFSGLAGCKKGGWKHGHATHWMPLPAPPLNTRDGQ